MLEVVPSGSGFNVSENGITIFRRHQPSARWDNIWMGSARYQGTLTRCFTRGAGAKVVQDYRFEVSGGFNGPPMGVRHPQERHPENKAECPRRFYGYGSGDGRWICPCGCAERSAVAIAARLGRATQDTTMYLFTDPPVLPCLECAISIMQAGINELVVDTLTWYEIKPNAVDVLELLREGGVLVRRPLI